MKYKVVAQASANIKLLSVDVCQEQGVCNEVPQQSFA